MVSKTKSAPTTSALTEPAPTAVWVAPKTTTDYFYFKSNTLDSVRKRPYPLNPPTDIPGSPGPKENKRTAADIGYKSIVPLPSSAIK